MCAGPSCPAAGPPPAPPLQPTRPRCASCCFTCATPASRTRLRTNLPQSAPLFAHPTLPAPHLCLTHGMRPGRRSPLGSCKLTSLLNPSLSPARGENSLRELRIQQVLNKHQVLAVASPKAGVCECLDIGTGVRTRALPLTIRGLWDTRGWVSEPQFPPLMREVMSTPIPMGLLQGLI